MAFLNKHELFRLGLKSFGDNVLISEKASLYSPENITLGNNVRIDDFCILSASTEITIGDYVHISCHATLIGRGRILVGDYCAISGRCSVYSSSDNYIGLGMVNPLVPTKYTNVQHEDVIIEKHCVLGCGCVVVPGIIIEEGCAVGAMSFINRSLPAWSMARGIPAKVVGPRESKIIKSYELKLKQDDDIKRRS